MDAKILGSYIAIRRKELGMTQAKLAEKIHVTDKAVSRWERGVGLPDIDNLEALAKALDVSLVSLMQGKVYEENQISVREAEELVTDTIKMSKESSKIEKGIWVSILGIFGIIIIFLCILLLRDGKIIFYSVASIITGLIAWGIPIIDKIFWKTSHVGRTMLVSVGFAFLSVWIQFLDIKNLAYTGNWSAIYDTINVLSVVVIMFCIITLLLNFVNIRKKYA
ncbi:helix-turn-helix domain-containing protein [uncultured Eubacterium sp.]|uniref:helix-turn-helix domain-containing protein n=1 Tax=uncultured Eubacterium sp. TaxID=165185 RepID=UPI0025D27CE3|nr:helix-turn-helix transcriptional regulator [uncultured Eubacterium sp.]MCI6538491.1 helix-turn-helix domain-containing protein [Lachnospiraceae bacterium]